MAGARVTVDVSKFEGEVAGLIERAGDCRVPLKAWGVYMVGSVKRNFDEQGRPVKWQRLKVQTLLRRYLRTAGARKLMDGADPGRGKFDPSPAVFKRGDKGAGAVSTVDGFLRSSKTGRILRSRHRGFNKIAKDGYVFRSAALKAVATGKILLDTGRLRKSITSKNAVTVEDRLKVSIGTNVVYAGVHQFGWEKLKIPARPFLVIQEPEDVEQFGDFLTRWLRNGEL